MNPAPGLFDLFSTTARSRRRRLNVNPHLADRLNPITSPIGKNPKTGSAGGLRNAVTTFDPTIATPSWEVYESPSAESLRGKPSQPKDMMAATTTADLVPQEAGAHFDNDRKNETTAHDRPERAVSPSAPSGNRINCAPDEASRAMADRMLRTLDVVLAEEKQRQDAAAAVAADPTVVRAIGQDELVRKLERKYAELTLLEEGRQAGEENNKNSSGSRRRRRHRIGVHRRESEGALEHVQGQSPARPQSGGRSEIYSQSKPEERIYGANIIVPTTGPMSVPMPMPTPTSTPTSITYISMSRPASGPLGLSFAERAKARAKARKRAKLAGQEGEGSCPDRERDRDDVVGAGAAARWWIVDLEGMGREGCEAQE